MSNLNDGITRRSLIVGVATAGLVVPEIRATAETPQGGGPKKSVMWTMLPASLSVEDRMQLAARTGFAGVEVPPTGDAAEITHMKAAAAAAGVHIHSVIYGGWSPPLTSPVEAQAQQCFQGAVDALHCASAYGAEDILLVPAVVDSNTTYTQAWHRSHDAIRRLLPVAERLKITICLEEVWNNFLLSPMEFAAYLDSFHSSWVRSYFDVGNVVIFGWPQDWVRTLRHRIKKVHLKDYHGGPGLFGGADGHWANIGEGSIDWQELRRAFAEIGFSDYMNLELAGGDEAYLLDVSHRVDRFLKGEKPWPVPT
jgi:hexulose-6-phosphate isomerase